MKSPDLWALFVFIFASSFEINSASSAKLRDGCSGLPATWTIQETRTIDLYEYRGCRLELVTDEGKIIAIKHENGPIADLKNFLTIGDGIGVEAKLIDFHIIHPNLTSELNVNRDRTAYTTGNKGFLEISTEVPKGFHLRLQKAVECPFNLGLETQCGRVLDDVSCYCAVFTKRLWSDQLSFCSSKGFKLIALETREEELAVVGSWGSGAYYWTSLNDIIEEGTWKWETTSQNLYPGYANWARNEPDRGSSSEDCMALYGNQWYAIITTDKCDGICENGP